MTESLITVNDLSKMYRVPEREAGLKAAFRSLVRRRYRDVLAVNGISFSVQAGEMVGFIGPNGAGKTTTLKILSGLLYPTGGEVRVAGFVPWERKAEFLSTIGMVMGNRHQLTWDNTVMDSLYILGEIYRVPRAQSRRTLDELVELLEIEELLPKMARNLSLGERMKCELAAALFYQPGILFLDEPTLGLDVTMQFRLRRFVAEYNQRHEATVILTSHYMADVSTLCPRVILINKGLLLFDGDLASLAAKIAPFKLIRLVVTEQDSGSVEKVTSSFKSVVIIEQSEHRYILRAARDEASAVAANLLNNVPLTDITVEDPAIEDVIDQVYREGVDA